MNELTIHIAWTGPYTYNDEFKKNIRIGLYQIYGSHPVYGEDTLLYIGKTLDGFGNRLKDREIITTGRDIENIRIYLGEVYSDTIYNTNNIDINKYISYAESLLINYHTPAKNSSNIQSFKQRDLNIRVINSGNYKMLAHELSTYGLFHDVNAFDELEELKKELKNTSNYESTEEFYGFYFDNQNFWIGFIYELWVNKRVLVLGCDKQICKNTLEYNDEWYYYELSGSQKEIKEQIEKYITIYK